MVKTFEGENGEKLWGMYHEIGHNLQDRDWTFSGTTEITCNIFTLYTMDTMSGIKPWHHKWVRRQFTRAKKVFDEGIDFQKWKHPGIGILIYAQLARDFGWDSYRNVFKAYESLPTNEKPQTDDEKIDQWIIRFSKEVQHNLCPMFEFWGFTIRDNVTQKIGNLPAYLHSDETTNDMAPERAQMIRDKYGVILDLETSETESGEPESDETSNGKTDSGHGKPGKTDSAETDNGKPGETEGVETDNGKLEDEVKGTEPGDGQIDDEAETDDGALCKCFKTS